MLNKNHRNEPKYNNAGQSNMQLLFADAEMILHIPLGFISPPLIKFTQC